MIYMTSLSKFNPRCMSDPFPMQQFTKNMFSRQEYKTYKTVKTTLTSPEQHALQYFLKIGKTR